MSTLLADGFEKALIGYGYQHSKLLAIYDYNICLDILQIRDGMNREEATEYMDYNVVGSYVGEYTPIFLDTNIDINEYE